ncbi:MAG: restriction endonuclease [Gloeocapsa sp. UFS-A4-WI-NPMV-4B04]|jgi:restriction system protein|nr:restriction endonuclease [Gloeocapsa sp. UFS-A4-WI-NPMV-4B04]
MGIFTFLILLCWFILLTWAFGFFRTSTPSQKPQSKSQPPKQSSPRVLEPQERDTTVSKPNLPRAPLQNKTISTSNRVIAPRQSPAFQKSRTRLTNKHQLNIQHGDRVLQQLRSKATPVELPMAIAMLRRMNPYAFEKLLLTCCEEQGWQIQRNFRYSNDGGVDGRVSITEKLYLIQAKRYTGHIKREHIRDFHKAIQHEGAAGGFFIHTGKTGPRPKELLIKYQIRLISGQQLVKFVLGQRLKFVGVTVAISSDPGSN